MATECRKRKINKRKLVRFITTIVLLVGELVLVGFTIGRVTAPEKTKTVTITETVEVPTYNADFLPEVSEIEYIDIPLSQSLQRYPSYLSHTVSSRRSCHRHRLLLFQSQGREQNKADETK